MPEPQALTAGRLPDVQPGDRVTVTQQIPQRDEVWTINVTGTVIKTQQKKTGSWFAHSKDHKLWLDRLTLKKDDGEIVMCNLDQFSHLEILPPAAVPAAASPVVEQKGIKGPDISPEEESPNA